MASQSGILAENSRLTLLYRRNYPSLVESSEAIVRRLQEFNASLYACLLTNTTILLLLQRSRLLPVATPHVAPSLLHEDLEHEDGVARRAYDVRRRDDRVLHLLQRCEDARGGAAEGEEPRDQRELLCSRPAAPTCPVCPCLKLVMIWGTRANTADRVPVIGRMYRYCVQPSLHSYLLRTIEQGNREADEGENDAENVAQRLAGGTLREATSEGTREDTASRDPPARSSGRE